MTFEPRGGWTATWAWRLCLVLGVALSAGCASSTPSPFAEARDRQLNVWVQNASRNGVDVTLLGNRGRRVELGRIESRRTETFRVQWRENLIRARIEIVAGRSFTTDPLLLTTQASIVIHVSRTLNRSSIRAN